MCLMTVMTYFYSYEEFLIVAYLNLKLGMEINQSCMFD